MATAPEESESPIVTALKAGTVKAEVTDLDHFRIRGGMAVETDYIISVTPNGTDVFDAFTLSKSYSAFRTLAAQMKKAADFYTTSKNFNELPQDAVKIAKYCELVSKLIESQKTQYLGKVNYTYVKVLAKQRSHIINDVLEATWIYFPKDVSIHPLLKEVTALVETFFLTDHCEAVGGGVLRKKGSTGSYESKNTGPLSRLGISNKSNSTGDETSTDTAMPKRSSVVVPMSRKSRHSDEQLEEVGQEPALLLEDAQSVSSMAPSYSRPAPVVRSVGFKIRIEIDNNPFIFAVIASVALYLVHLAALRSVVMDGDIALLAIFAAFCVGLHTPRPLVGGFDAPTTMKVQEPEDMSGRKLLRRSMAVTPRQSVMHARASMAAIIGPAAAAMLAELDDEDEEEETVLGSPMPMFPPGATIGTVNNCWSQPEHETFQVRGANYFTDKKKVESDEFLFPARGVDLFLTDTCPENVGSSSSVFGGNLRDLPTFIINFQMPWGVFIFYFEVPKRFIPFIKAGYEEDFDKSKLPSLEKMPAGDRTACRFFMGSRDHKNSTLKIVTAVVDGPWIVKQVFGLKPTLIGNRLPVNYVYEPQDGNKAMYLEADLDLAASPTARTILSVTRPYNQILTLDIGFVVQGDQPDELPEQMLFGTRLHRVDPLTAPSFPPMKSLFVSRDDNPDSDGDSVTPEAVVMSRE